MRQQTLSSSQQGETRQTRSLRMLKGAYALFYGAGGALEPFLPVFFVRRGYTVAVSALLVALQPAAVCLSAPLATWLSDAFGSHGTSAAAFAAAAAVAAPLLFLATPADAAAADAGFGLPLALTLLLALSRAPLPPLLDSAAMRALSARPQRYGELRQWGSIGFGVSALLVGFLADAVGDGACFAVFAAGVFFSGVLLRAAIAAAVPPPAPLLPSSDPAAAVAPTATAVAVEEDGGGNESTVGTPSARKGLRAMVRQMRELFARPGVFRFAGIVFAMGVTHSVVNHFVPLLLTKTLQAPNSAVGVGLALAVISELPAFRYVRRVNDPSRLIRLAHYATVARMLAYALSVSVYSEDSWLFGSLAVALALCAQLLHGLTFSMMWSATVVVTNSLAPPGLSATAQGMMTAVYIGIAAATGTFFGGAMYGYSPATLFLATAAIGAASLAAFSRMAPPTAAAAAPGNGVDEDDDHHKEDETV